MEKIEEIFLILRFKLTSPVCRSWSMQGWPSLGEKIVYLIGKEETMLADSHCTEFRIR